VILFAQFMVIDSARNAGRRGVGWIKKKQSVLSVISSEDYSPVILLNLDVLETFMDGTQMLDSDPPA
jgi:hypothetical protein